MGTNNEYVLAMYDVRGKQDFIFKTNHVQEIIGGSEIIKNCFEDYLIPASKTVAEDGANGIYIYTENEKFSRESFENHMKKGYVGEVVYNGGGNFLVLFRNKEICKKVTYGFTKEVMMKVGTLRVLSSFVEDVDFDDYKEDSRRLYAVHGIRENSESNIAPWATLPICQVDYRTSMPLTDTITRERGTGKVTEKITKETKAKIDKYRASDKDFEEGEESLRAVVYIDGNSMGAQVTERINGLKSYEECVNELRVFSAGIQKNYIDDRIEALVKVLKNDQHSWRKILGAGDEINFICDAKQAFELVKTYLEGLPEGCSSCAGITIFHSHAPYSEAYRIAEECCESGKKLMKEKALEGTSFLDFHYAQSAIDVSLDKIRETEGTLGSISRPWLIKGNVGEGITKLEDVIRMKNFLNQLGRSNVKGLLEPAKKGDASLQLELMRIKAHMSEELRNHLEDDFDFAKNNAKLLYDVILVYDIWFDKQ